MTPEHPQALQATRRHFFGRCGLSLGSIALGSLLSQSLAAGESAASGIRCRGK